MKQTFLLSACVAALLASTPALAVTPAPTGNNSSTVTQDGATEIAQITQNGANDVSVIQQNQNATNTSANNKAVVTMTGNSGGKSNVIQSGVSNTATVTTTDDGSL